MPDSVTDPGLFLFGPFRLDPVRRTLHRGGAPLTLAPRAFDALLCLVQNAGRTVDRQELMHAIWGGRIVEEANLKQTIYELRKVLESGASDRLVITVPMRGYRLAAAVSVEAPERVRRPGPSWARFRPGRAAALTGGLALLAGLSLLPWLMPRTPPGTEAAFAPPPHSLAVLPFANDSGDARQDYFSDGLSAELINALARIDGIRVAARTSSFAFRGRPRPATEIARLLNVGAVLEGSVSRQGSHVHITAELVDSASGFAFWSHSYDSDTGDLSGAPARIAASVAASMQIALLGDAATGLALGGTRDPAAFDAYLQGMKSTRGGDDFATHDAARAAFGTAIALDPQFALARANRARELALLSEDTITTDPARPQQLLREAMAEADRALAIAPRLGVAHLARYDVLMAEQDFTGAEQEMALAREDAPGDVQVLTDFAFLQVSLGHAPAGLAAAERVVGLDPLTPASYIALAYAQRASRNYADALASLHRARILGAHGSDVELMEAIVAMERGDNHAAQLACARGGGWENHLCLAVVEHRLGLNNEALFHLAALRGMLGANGAFQYAEIYAQWRQPAEAVKWLEAARASHDPGLMMLRSDALLDPIRGTPQYAVIEKQLHFPP